MYPCDLRNLLVAARTDASSSTTETADTVDKTDLPDAKAGVVRQKLSAENVLRINILLSYLGLRDRTSQDVDAGIAGLPAPRASRLPVQDWTDRSTLKLGKGYPHKYWRASGTRHVGEGSLLPATSTWAKFNAVLAGCATERRTNLLIEHRSRSECSCFVGCRGCAAVRSSPALLTREFS